MDKIEQERMGKEIRKRDREKRKEKKIQGSNQGILKGEVSLYR